jgi:uncharacterized protein (DUF1330 family)
MATGYWIGRLDVTDLEGYKPYVAANAEPFRKYGARFLVRGGKFETLEGESRSRNVVLAFVDFAAALACYRSPEYSAAKALRAGKAISDLVVIEGTDTAPAPGDGVVRGYWCARVDITEPAAYQAYMQADAEGYARYGGRFLVRGGRFEPVEGQARSRNLLIEFPDMASARAYYHSPEYQRAAMLRRGKAIFDLIIIEGYAGPQPGDVG